MLAVELENVLDRDATLRGDMSLRRLYATLHGLQERMLVQIAAAGLEVVRLRGAAACNVRDVVEVESWRYDDAYTGEVVVDELEVAVRLDGRPVRRGRVVMGAPAGAASQVPAPARTGRPRLGRPAAPAPRSSGPSRPARPDGHIVCPVPGCGAEIDTGTEVCVGCLTHLSGYIRLLLHPHALFNRGLRAARAGDSRARATASPRWCCGSRDDVRTRATPTRSPACTPATDHGATCLGAGAVAIAARRDRRPRSDGAGAGDGVVRRLNARAARRSVAGHDELDLAPQPAPHLVDRPDVTGSIRIVTPPASETGSAAVASTVYASEAGSRRTRTVGGCRRTARAVR